MVDSELVGIGGEVPPGLAKLPVMPKASGEGEQAGADPGAETRQGASPVALEPELTLAGPKHRFDPLPNPAEGAKARLLVLSVRPQEGGAAVGHPALELGAGKALVGDDRVAIEADPLEHLPSHLALGGVGGRQLERDRGAVGGAEQVEAKAPEVAGMASAVAVGGDAGELRAPSGLARGRAGDGGRVEEPEAVAERGRDEGEVVDRPFDLGAEAAKALVVARLLRQVGEQVPEPVGGEGEELAVVGEPHEDLGDRQGDELGIADPGRAPRTAAPGQEIVGENVNCREKGVELGVHEATSVVDVALTTPSFGALRAASSQRDGNLESGAYPVSSVRANS